MVNWSKYRYDGTVKNRLKLAYRHAVHAVWVSLRCDITRLRLALCVVKDQLWFMVYHWPWRRIASWQITARTISCWVSAWQHRWHRNMARLHRLLWFIDDWIFLPDWCNHRWCRFVCCTTIADGAERYCRNLLQKRHSLIPMRSSAIRATGAPSAPHHRLGQVSQSPARALRKYYAPTLLMNWLMAWWSLCDLMRRAADYSPAASSSLHDASSSQQWSAMVRTENRSVTMCVPLSTSFTSNLDNDAAMLESVTGNCSFDISPASTTSNRNTCCLLHCSKRITPKMTDLEVESTGVANTPTACSSLQPLTG